MEEENVSPIIKHTFDIILKAVEHDENGNNHEALQLYTQAIQLLLVIVKKETNAEKAAALEFRAGEIMTRAEQIKEHLQKHESVSKPVSDDITHEWTVVFRIVKVECYLLDRDTGETKQLSHESQPLQLLTYKGRAILKAGDSFCYELNKSIPCLAIEHGRYVLPGLANEYYGIKFPDGIPLPYINIFEQKMELYCAFSSNKSSSRPIIEEPNDNLEMTTYQQPKSHENQAIVLQQPESNKVASGIEIGGKIIAHGIITGGEFITKGIVKGGMLLKEQITPSENDIQIPDAVKTTISGIKEITPHAVKLTESLVGAVSYIAKEIGSAIAQEIQKASKDSKSLSDPKFKAVKEVGLSSIVAVVNVWGALEEAGVMMLSGAGSTTVDLVNHKFGNEAGKVAQDSFSIGSDTLKVYSSVKSLAPKAIAKSVVKKSGKAVVASYISGESELRELKDKQSGLEEEKLLSDSLLPANNSSLLIENTKPNTTEVLVIENPQTSEQQNNTLTVVATTVEKPQNNSTEVTVKTEVILIENPQTENK